MWCWRRLYRIPWTARRLNQSIIKEINPEYSLEGLMLKLKLQYFGHLIWRTASLEKTQMLEKIEDRRMKTQDEMLGWHHPLNGHEFERLWRTGKPGVLQSMVLQRVGHDWATRQQNHLAGSILCPLPQLSLSLPSLQTLSIPRKQAHFNALTTILSSPSRSYHTFSPLPWDQVFQGLKSLMSLFS